MNRKQAPLSDENMAKIMLHLGDQLRELQPTDLLTVAGFLATKAIRGWPSPERRNVAADWAAHFVLVVADGLEVAGHA